LNIVKETRKRLGQTQVDFASLIGVHSLSIIRWEAGRPAVTSADRICRLILKRRRLPQADRLKGWIRSEGGQAALEKLFTAEGTGRAGTITPVATEEEEGAIT
jgi:DNA-binding XRE family transcriptional regulator